MLKKLLEHFIKRKRQLVPVPVDLSKLSDVVKNDVVKKAVYNKLVEKVNNIDISGFVLKTQQDTDKIELENKIPDTSGIVKKKDYNAKITEIQGKILSICGLGTNAALTAIKADLENKIPNISSLVKKTDYNTKITEIENKLTDHNHDEYITTPEFKLTAQNFAARLKQANVVAKTGFDDQLKSLNQKVNSDKTKHLLVENELKNYKRLIQFKVILKKIEHKVIQCFRQYTDILRRLLFLIIFQNVNLKDCLMKVLRFLLYLIIFLILH